MEEKTAAEEITSAQQTLSSSFDPGWNDPPKWAFTPTPNTGATPTKRLLNKRVAFPLSSASLGTGASNDQPSSAFASNLPPPVQSLNLTTAPHAPLCAPSGKIASCQSRANIIDKNEALEDTMKNFEAFMMEKLESSSKVEEVTRRLDVMKTMWREDKIKDDVCNRVLKISKALRNNDADTADKIHVSLVMEHAAVCNTWISGIRHMILELREKNSETNSTSTLQDQQPYLLPQAVKENETT